MPVYSFEGIVPVVDRTAYLHPTAVLIGDVIVGPGCYVGPHASLRGDFGRIVIAADASIQDSCTLHTGPDSDCVVSRGATIGHGAVLHGCTIGTNALVGINSVVLDGAVVGDECLVAALSLIKAHTVVPNRYLVVGNPGRLVRKLSENDVRWRNDGHGPYQVLVDRSISLIECEPLTEVEPNRRRQNRA